MRTSALVALILAAPLAAGDATPPPAEGAAPVDSSKPADAKPDLRQQVSYLFGLRVKMMIERSIADGDLDRDTVMKGLQEAMAGTAKEPEPAEQQKLFEAYDMQLQGKRRTQQAAQQQARAQSDPALAAQLADNTTYLAENGKKKGVTTTASGLQYEITAKGAAGAKKPGPTSTVRVHYTGTKRDGTVFDSSVKRGEPAEFPLNRVIPGWTEGLQLMAEGDKFRFTIPSGLAYGENAPGEIGANQILIFDVELIKVLN